MSCGYDSLPEQVNNRHKLSGLSFNILVIGSTGIGKTTLINSLFNFDYGDSPDYERKLTNVDLKIKEFRPSNKTMEMKFTIIEAKGFDNRLDKSDSYKPIVDYIEDRFNDHLSDEVEVQETRYNDISDARVHCCIYIISPIGTGLKSIDLVTMKQLHQKVCLIPVIGKSDVLTKQERQAFKERVRQEITTNEIEIYSSKEHQLPIAIAASNQVTLNENGECHRVREYPWGSMIIERDSEFSELQDLMFRSDMLPLIKTTDRVHYENYRKRVNSDDRLLDLETEKADLLREYEQLIKEREQLKEKKMKKELPGEEEERLKPIPRRVYGPPAFTNLHYHSNKTGL